MSGDDSEIGRLRQALTTAKEALEVADRHIVEHHSMEIMQERHNTCPICKDFKVFTQLSAARRAACDALAAQDYPMASCPKCGAEQEDMDGFGILHCSKCGYCCHPDIEGGVCKICGHCEGGAQ